MRRLISIAVTCLLCLSISARADIVYTGSLSLNDGGLFGAGFETGDNAILEWVVSRDPSGDASGVYDPWHYKYTLNFKPDVDNAISHIAIEVSDNFDSIFNLQVSPIGYYTAGAPEPGSEPTSQDWVPGDMYAIKFDAAAGSDVVDSLTIEFDSMRVPEWGDANAKGGNVGTSGWYIYNSGFTAADDNDPIFDLSDLTDEGFDGMNHTWSGSVDNHVIVPDTNVVPVPTSILLGMLGLSAAGIKLRKVA